MAHLSMNEITTFRWSFEEDVENYRAAGIDAIAIWRQKLSDFGEEKGQELLDEAGLNVSALLWAGGFTGSDGRTFRESVDDALEAVQLASDLRAGCLILYSGARAGHTHNHARRLFRNALKEMAPLAVDRRVALAIEPMHAGCASEWTFLTCLEDTLDLIDSVDCPRVQLAFDVYHLGQDPAVLDRLPGLVPRLALVQLGDAHHAPNGEQNRCRLGEGRLPLREMIETLKSAGYEGYYDVELMGEDLDNADYRDLLLHSKQAFDELIGAPV
ncbi:MAG: sugar phosphate isomerase/epimerase [Planctomycetes bacterium]|nr:sugar phosphate isomerase/epimerase [Planctomycetota bacterium]